ncbi:hypothetical protein F5878DRAFT_67740 [Lentinula raphanica]|uniref:Uncharacterized protein n=1 Tax=Lentinula raphanica TaxID=153919 RepID=A0AA38PCQ2_9AGAR|nr:hypothetical protein F5878DRAFT_67740 [Lentinula raphanica]
MYLVVLIAKESPLPHRLKRSPRSKSIFPDCFHCNSSETLLLITMNSVMALGFRQTPDTHEECFPRLSLSSRGLTANGTQTNITSVRSGIVWHLSRLRQNVANQNPTSLLFVRRTIPRPRTEAGPGSQACHSALPTTAKHSTEFLASHPDTDGSARVGRVGHGINHSEVRRDVYKYASLSSGGGHRDMTWLALAIKPSPNPSDFLCVPREEPRDCFERTLEEIRAMTVYGLSESEYADCNIVVEPPTDDEVTYREVY